MATLARHHPTSRAWGNHDLGLCRAVDERTRQRYPARVLDYMATLQPRLVLDECHFSHVEPSVDPYDALAMWTLDDEPLDFASRALRSFAAVTQRLVFVGHYHRWLAATATGPLDWQGEGPLSLAGSERYFVVVGAVFQGHCGILGTDQSELCPLRC